MPSSPERRRLSLNHSLVLGVLLFGLFFGSGNVIFPVKLGQMAGRQFIPAAIGFIITAAGLPVLGTIASALSGRESLYAFSSAGGKGYGLFFTLALYLTIGPFFAIPRNATVSFEVGLRYYLGDQTRVPLLIYSLIFFALVLFFAARPSRILDVVGRFLTPLFVVLIAILLITAIVRPLSTPADHLAEGVYAEHALSHGILEGYNTMDALASLAFAAIIIGNVQMLGVHRPRRIARETIRSSLFTILLLGLLYIGLVYLGVTTRPLTTAEQNGGLILGIASHHYFGPAGQILLAATITVACLKTAIGLVVSISETFEGLFPKVSYKVWMVLFTIVSFIVANFGLDTIISVSIPVLMFLYPLAIVMIFMWIGAAFFKVTPGQFKMTLGFAGVAAVFDMLRALPGGVATWPPTRALMTFAEHALPFYKLGLAWLIPSVVGFVLGAILFHKQDRLRTAKAVPAVDAAP